MPKSEARAAPLGGGGRGRSLSAAKYIYTPASDFFLANAISNHEKKMPTKTLTDPQTLSEDELRQALAQCTDGRVLNAWLSGLTVEATEIFAADITEVCGDDIACSMWAWFALALTVRGAEIRAADISSATDEARRFWEADGETFDVHPDFGRVYFRRLLQSAGISEGTESVLVDDISARGLGTLAVSYGCLGLHLGMLARRHAYDARQVEPGPVDSFPDPIPSPRVENPDNLRVSDELPTHSLAFPS